MANNNNFFNDGDSVSKIKAFTNSLISSQPNDVSDATDTEKIDEEQIYLDADDIVLFNKKDTYSQCEILQNSSLQNIVFNTFNQMFCDLRGVRFYRNAYRGFIFEFCFSYTPNESYEEIKKNNPNAIRCIESSIDPNKLNNGTSKSELLLMINQNQQKNAYDATKYAKISMDAKKKLTSLLYIDRNNMQRKKSKWNKNENYVLETKSGTSTYQGARTFTNIIGTVFLDAAKVIEIICCTENDIGKYDFNFFAVDNTSRSDALVKIEKVNRKRKNELVNQYGVMYI